jgi:hypothetical protein
VREDGIKGKGLSFMALSSHRWVETLEVEVKALLLRPIAQKFVDGRCLHTEST